MRFTRLRLSGFKSFIEPTELHIEPGLTAIVGPNGCGKSNLFDALRWVMGETRPTSVRGSEMDDVIFAGSANRPSRNMAEVSLIVDNTDRKTAGAYAEFDTIEVSRRIEREAGSAYHINGRDVRQRDVQIFFADASSGAGSTAFVRQGQIGLLISQKPLARRAILEEAAGISGLHQRRHEAELRLRAAETNLARLDDVIREVETQLQNLKKQARQASRYRNLSGHIRKAEALAHFLRWTQAAEKLDKAEEELAATMAAVESCTAQAAEASTRQANAAAEITPLRDTESQKAAALHRLIVEREALESEETRAREAAQRLRQRIAQAEQDKSREQTLDADAEAALGKLNEEVSRLDNLDSAGTSLAEVEDRTRSLSEAAQSAEAELERATSALADWLARKAGAERGLTAARELLGACAQQLSDARAELATLKTASPGPQDGRDNPDARRLRAGFEAARLRFAETRTRLAAAEREEETSRGPLEQTDLELQRLNAEAMTLRGILHLQHDGSWPPLADSVKVQAGYEVALATALGDELRASLDETAPAHWRDLGALDTESIPLPGRVAPLSRFVTAPAALSRRLGMTGVVFPDQGKELQKQLGPGQRLVSARGDLWRWDGYTASCKSLSHASSTQGQQARLLVLEAEIARAEEVRVSALSRHDAARSALLGAREEEVAAERSLSESERLIVDSEDNIRSGVEHASRLAFVEAEIRRVEQLRDSTDLQERREQDEVTRLGDGEALRAAQAAARAKSAAAQSDAGEANAVLRGLSKERDTRNQRRNAIEGDRTRWRLRRAAAAAQVQELFRRIEELAGELKSAESVPDQIRTRQHSLLDAIALAESAKNKAADTRTQAEGRLAECDKVAKLADTALSSAREERARCQALHEAAESRVTELRSRIRDELDADPSELAERAEIVDDEELPPLEQAEKRVEKLKQEREQLGGVNLRAEEEASEQDLRLKALTADRNDLQGAIDRLRRGIQTLNREGRERLLESFEKVNRNFSDLFVKLFQGGEAKLTFTESEDPLEAGLEIYARPPGKRLQSLALLSGGEQALAALALILAVFLVNPAPICVLDEVDAPLDDANVERFCNLLDEMTRLADTRFLVITHHALTMSRMDRLFGVTMAERGVSQLVSVNLAEAERVAAE